VLIEIGVFVSELEGEGGEDALGPLQSSKSREQKKDAPGLPSVYLSCE
jgi:hypothetical protein